jgi:hypothetical protein
MRPGHGTSRVARWATPEQAVVEAMRRRCCAPGRPACLVADAAREAERTTLRQVASGGDDQAGGGRERGEAVAPGERGVHAARFERADPVGAAEPGRAGAAESDGRTQRRFVRAQVAAAGEVLGRRERRSLGARDRAGTRGSPGLA